MFSSSREKMKKNIDNTTKITVDTRNTTLITFLKSDIGRLKYTTPTKDVVPRGISIARIVIDVLNKFK